MPTVSILIPTHNRAAILKRTLESLQQIHIPPEVTVETVIIANACTDDTVTTVQSLQSSFPHTLRVVEEPEPGLNPARNRALREATADLLAFLDDDVWVDANWLIGLLAAFNTPGADIVGGRVTLWWEALEKPAWMDRRSEHLLTCTEQGPSIVELHHAGETVGANFAFRRSVLTSVGNFSDGLDRVGTLTLGGGDTDFMARGMAAGHRLFYAPDAWVKHWVAPQRATEKYLCSVAYGNSIGRGYVRPSAGWTVLLESAYRVSVYTIAYTFAAVIRNKKSKIKSHIRQQMALGVIVGVWRKGHHQRPDGSALPASTITIGHRERRGHTEITEDDGKKKS